LQVGNVDILTCDLLQPLLQRLEGKVDLLVLPETLNPYPANLDPQCREAWQVDENIIVSHAPS